MANATIYSNPVSYLSWSSSSSVTILTENSTTNVTNSSGATVYWTEGTNSGSVANNGTLQCQKGAVDKTWGFDVTSGGSAAKITLTVTSSGGG